MPQDPSNRIRGSRDSANRRAAYRISRKHRDSRSGTVDPRTIGYGGGETHPAREAELPKIKARR